jgi:type VI secretion system protein ImpL
VVDGLQPADYFNDRAAYGAFTSEPSPFKLLLLEVRRNTTFEGGLAKAAGRALKGPLASPAGRLAREAVAGRSTPDAGALIAAHFKPVQDYAGDGKSPAPVDALVAAVRDAGTARTAATLAGGGAAGDAVQAQLNVAMASVASAAARAPAALQPFVTAAAQGGRTAAAATGQGAVTDAYEREIAGPCRSVTQDRYPFYGAAQNDAAAADMLRLFGLNGQIDSFTQRRLLPLLDTAGPVWRWRSDDPVAAQLDPISAEQLHRAVEIRDLLAGGLPLKVEPAGFGGQVTAAELTAGGATQRFERSDARARPLMWSLSGGLPEARLVLLGSAGEIARFEAQGAWAPFRLMDQARRENAGPNAIKATFGEGATAATFRILLPSDRNPFGRGGLWSFRCPGAL